MQVKASLKKFDTLEGEDLAYIFLDVMIEEIDELLFRKPEYTLRGKRKLVITFYNLAPREGERIYSLLQNEIQNGCFVENAIIYRNPKEEEPIGPYLFIPPTLTEEGKKEIERKKGKGMDLERMMSLIIKINTDVLLKMFEKDNGKSPAPWTVKTCLRYRQFCYLEPPEDPEDPEYMITLYELDAEAGYFHTDNRKPRKRAPKPPKVRPVETGTVGPGGVISNKRRARSKRGYKPPREIKRKGPRPDKSEDAPHLEEPTAPLKTPVSLRGNNPTPEDLGKLGNMTEGIDRKETPTAKHSNNA